MHTSNDIVLALETATDNCSVALLGPDSSLHEYNAFGRGVHSEAVFTGVHQILAIAGIAMEDVDLLLLSGGPGSYTGLRVGFSAAKGLLFGQQTRLFTVNTLLAGANGLLLTYPGYQRMHIVLDAKRKHFIYQAFDVVNDVIRPEGVPGLIPIASLAGKLTGGDIVAGTGLERIDFPVAENVNVVQDFTFSASLLIETWRVHSVHPELAMIINADPASVEPMYLTSGV